MLICLWIWYFHIYNCSQKRKKNINLLLQTSVQISDNFFFKIKKEEMENFSSGMFRAVAQPPCLIDSDAFLLS